MVHPNTQQQPHDPWSHPVGPPQEVKSAWVDRLTAVPISRFAPFERVVRPLRLQRTKPRTRALTDHRQAIAGEKVQGD
jgi:hypothetical protein